MWGSVLFQSPTVYQERNEHNLQIDFNEEIVCYKKAWDLIDTLRWMDISNLDSPKILINIYKKLVDEWYFSDVETESLNCWVSLFN